ncbi:MAG: hypothetical protein ACUVTL_00620 [Thermoproteota archaeon]
MVKIVSRKFGLVEEELVRLIKIIMEECYHRLEPHNVSYVDLYLFEDHLRMRSYFNIEKLNLGVLSMEFNDTFTAQHDAWRGTSRISICIDKLESLTKDVQLGTIRHEVGHSVLHGSIEHYVIPITLVKSTVAKSEIPEDFALNFLYLLSIAVKDYEVSRLLSRNGYLEDQIAYSKNNLITSEEDKIAWLMSVNNPSAKIMCLLSRFKDVCCMAPFLQKKEFGSELLDHTVQRLSYMGDQILKKILIIVTDYLPKLGEDTLSNIVLLSDAFLRTFLCE